MRILMLSWRDPWHPLAGGGEQVVWEHVRGWVAAGHEATWFASSFSGARREEERDGIKIVRRGNQILGVQIAAFFWYVFGKHLKFDLVVDQFHGIPFFTPLYVKVPKLAIIQEVARKVWMVNDLPKPWNLILGSLGYMAEPVAFWFYKNVQFMTGSYSAKEDVVKMGISPGRIAVILHGVIVDVPKKLPRKEKLPTVMFLGALAKDKGVEDAIKTFGILNGKGNYNFWIVGKGGEPYLSYLRETVERRDLKGRVKFWGFVEQRKKFELLARAWVLVNPSVHEGWGLVNIEANAVGTPVVAYRVPGLVDSVREGMSGVFCEKNTPESLAGKVIELLGDWRWYGRLVRGALNWSKQFNWRKSTEMSLKLVAEVVGVRL